MNYDHINSSFHYVMELSNEERIDFLNEPRWIGYSRACKIIEIIHSRMNQAKKPRTVGLVLYGESAIGKTTLIQRFNYLYGQSEDDFKGDPIRPVIIAEAPSVPDEKELYASILEKFWAPYKDTAQRIKLKYQVIHLFQLCKVKVLFIDEFHAMLSGSEKKQLQILNAIKALSNELKILIVCVGTKSVSNVFSLDKQYLSRFDAINLPKWKEDEFQTLLYDFERVLPLKKPSKLYSPEKAELLFNISNSNIGDLHKILIECAIEAITSGKEEITSKIINKNSWIKSNDGKMKEIIIE